MTPIGQNIPVIYLHLSTFGRCILTSILRLNLVLTYGIPLDFRSGVHLCIPPYAIGPVRVYRDTQLRTDDVYCRESAGTGPVNLKVVSNECCLCITMDQLICASLSHTRFSYEVDNMLTGPASYRRTIERRKSRGFNGSIKTKTKTKTKQNKKQSNVTQEKYKTIFSNQTPGGYKFVPLVANHLWQANQVEHACFGLSCPWSFPSRSGILLHALVQPFSAAIDFALNCFASCSAVLRHYPRPGMQSFSVRR